MSCVKEFKKISKKIKFQEIDPIITNIDLFKNYSLNSQKDNDFKKDQLFTITPPLELVENILKLITMRDIDDVLYYEFSKKNIIDKNIIDKIQFYIPELKKYYLKCKHKKYLENLTDKKIITIFRQLLRVYDFNLRSIEKYNNGKKYLLYIIDKKKNLSFKKVNSIINFD
jgi:hypothetical protein